MPKISVIVPIYKVEKYLNRCVDSILHQTFTDFELILVDDGSPDNCGKMCDEYAEKDSRVVVIHKKNGGLSDARNKGLDWVFANSNSEYVVFIDSDDYIDERYLELLYKSIESNDADLAMCSLTHVDEFDCTLDGYCYESWGNGNISRDDVFLKLNKELSAEIVSAWNKIYRRYLFNNLRYRKGKAHEDEFIIHLIIGKCKKISFINESLYYYRHRAGSIMATRGTKEVLDAFEAYIERGRYYLKNRIPLEDNFEDFFRACLKVKMNIWQKFRFDLLKIKYRKVFFTKKDNRKPVMYFWYDWYCLYRLLLIIKRGVLRLCKK